MYYCNVCGPGDAVDLLRLVFRYSRSDATKILRAAIERGEYVKGRAEIQEKEERNDKRVGWTPRCSKILKECAPLSSVEPVVAYLRARRLPIPNSPYLLAHPMLEYWDKDDNGLFQIIGTWPAMVAVIVDVTNRKVSLHVTWIKNGQKAPVRAPRKILTRIGGFDGSAIRMFRPKDGHVGVCEGIETAIAARAITGIPTWSVLCCTMMEKWAPPDGITDVTIFPDNDPAGLQSGIRLQQRLLENGVKVQMRLLKPQFNDWADAFTVFDRPSALDVEARM